MFLFEHSLADKVSKKGLYPFKKHAYTYISLDGTVPTFPKQDSLASEKYPL